MSGIFSRWGRSRAQADDNNTSTGNGAAPSMDAAAPPAAVAANGNAEPAAATPATPASTPMPSAPVTFAPQAAPASNGKSDGTFVSTMMDFPLTLQHTFNRAATLFPDREIVTNAPEGPQRTTYGAWARRVHRLAYVLDKLGVKQGDRVGTLAWNNATHLELYFGVPNVGAVLHTLNLRLFPQDLAYIINDAQDGLIFVDADLIPLLERISDQ